MQTASLRRSRALRLSILAWSSNAPLLGTSSGGYGEVWARDSSAKTRDQMMEYVGEAMDDRLRLYRDPLTTFEQGVAPRRITRPSPRTLALRMSRRASPRRASAAPPRRRPRPFHRASTRLPRAAAERSRREPACWRGAARRRSARGAAVSPPWRGAKLSAPRPTSAPYPQLRPAPPHRPGPNGPTAAGRR